MRNIGICDNRKSHCADMEAMILNYGESKKEELCIKVWYSGEEVCQYLTKGNNLDVLFLEVELGKVSGIRIGEFIRNQTGRQENADYIHVREKILCPIFI